MRKHVENPVKHTFRLPCPSLINPHPAGDLPKAYHPNPYMKSGCPGHLVCVSKIIYNTDCDRIIKNYFLKKAS